jgi:catechol 2,3-dioxygenase-like lactoylglutathione lyase family enzyme
VKIQFIAGFGPIAPDKDASLRLYRDALGIALPDQEGTATTSLDGVKYFHVWPLAQAALSCFGTNLWPAHIPAPQAWLEFDVESAAAVRTAATELEGKGFRLLVKTRDEPWGQTVTRLLSPEGLLVGVTFTPWQHEG